MILLKNTEIISIEERQTIPGMDILIDNDKIVEIGKGLSEDNKKVIECEGKLALPGMLNPHLHSDENFFKGLFDNLPLELWMLYSCPPLEYGPFSNRLIYLRTLLGGIEMLKNGITCVQDDVSECPIGTVDGYDAVFQAYTDLGIKANIGLNQSDKSYCDKIPFTEQYFPEDLIKQLSNKGDDEAILSLYKQIVGKWHGKNGHKVVMSTSAPQRCTDEYLLKALKFANEYDLPMHSHILESRIQYMTGKEFYGESIVKHAARIGFLSDRLSIIHGVWLDDSDMDLIQQHGCSVIHNPVSNLKLGSGIMPLIRMREKGVHVTIGTDGMSSNDGQNMFEAMKYTALLQKVTTPQFSRWLEAWDILQMAYGESAYSMKREHEIGKIEIGKSADIVLLNKNNPTYMPCNDISKHLVYCENGSSVDMVISSGRVVVEDKKLKTIDESKCLQEINDICQEFFERFEKTKIESNRIAPYLQKVYDRSITHAKGKKSNLF